MLWRIVKAWLPVVVLCAVIFLFSQDANSGRHSDTVLGWILDLVGLNAPHWHRVLDGPFRKLAHVIVYFLLGLVTYRGFSLGQKWYSLRAGMRSLVFCAVYASTDEYHQSFVAGRGPSLHDVALDTSAAALALVLLWLWKRSQAGGRVKALAHEDDPVTQ